MNDHDVGIIALQIFTAALFLAYGAWLIWRTDKVAHARGDDSGFWRGKREGVTEGEINGYVIGERSGRERGHADGYEDGFKDAQPIREPDGKFKRRTQ
jgi:hypothetical protein